MYDELQSHLGHLNGKRFNADIAGAADGRPLPGGDVLVLLSAGSQGLQDDAKTAKDSDPSSVAFTLEFWREEWEDTRGDRVTHGRARSSRAKVRQAVGYLEVHARWAAQQHPGFDDFAEDVQLLHQRLERATGRGDRPERAEAECFQCGADALVRQTRDGTRCDHHPPSFPPPWPGPVPCTTTARRQHFLELVAAYEAAHGACQQGGHEDQWTCGRCGATYDWQRYLLACRARVEDGRKHLRLVGWGTVAQVAAAVGTPVETVRTWAKRGLVTTCCQVQSQQQLVWYPDADERAERNRKAAARRAERQAG